MSDAAPENGKPCGCLECRAAEVDQLPARFVPGEGVIHGYRLRRWHDAKNEALAVARKRLGIEFKPGDF